MTNFGSLILILISVGIGFVLEPIVISDEKKPSSANTSDTDETIDDQEDSVTETPTDPEIQVDLSKVTPSDFPDKVSLKAPLTIKDDATGVTMTLKKGNTVKPLNLKGDQLVIQPVGFPVKGMIHVDKTDFKKLVVPLMMARLKAGPVAKNNPTPKPEPTPAPAPAPKPAPVAPAPAPTPPAPTPDPTSVVKKLDEAAIIAIMKASVKDRKVTEFQANQVTAWKAGADMTFEEESYQIGRVTFKAETILGVQEHDAIALIKDGKVRKWMWAKTKLEMR